MLLPPDSLVAGGGPVWPAREWHRYWPGDAESRARVRVTCCVINLTDLTVARTSAKQGQ